MQSPIASERERRRWAPGSGRASGPARAFRGIVPFVLLALFSTGCGGTAASRSASGSTSAAVPSQATAVAQATRVASQTLTPSATPAPSATPLPSGVLASIPLTYGGHGGLAPSVAAIGFGSVWVETHRGTQLFRIDPTTDTVIASIDVGQESCGEPEIGFGRVWLGPCDSSTKTIAVDPASNQVVGSFDAFGGTMAFTSDAAWIPDQTGKLMKIDPSSYRTLATFDVFPDGFVGWVVSAAGSIWAAAETAEGVWGGQVAKIDPGTGQVISRLTVPDPGSYASVTADLGYIWLKGDVDGRLVRIDPNTGAMTSFDLPGFKGLSQLYDVWPATGLGSVWVRLADDAVSRVDPKTGKIIGTYPADAAGGGGWPAVGFGSLWVPNFGSDTIWRDRIAP
jgi:glutamine cyclotransferase